MIKGQDFVVVVTKRTKTYRNSKHLYWSLTLDDYGKLKNDFKNKNITNNIKRGKSWVNTRSQKYITPYLS